MKIGKIFKNPFSAALTVFCALAILVFTGCSGDQAKDNPEDLAKVILDQSGVRGGFIVHVNCVQVELQVTGFNLTHIQQIIN